MGALVLGTPGCALLQFFSRLKKKAALSLGLVCERGRRGDKSERTRELSCRY